MKGGVRDEWARERERGKHVRAIYICMFPVARSHLEITSEMGGFIRQKKPPNSRPVDLIFRVQSPTNYTHAHVP